MKSGGVALVLLVLAAVPATARDAVGLLRRGERAERTVRYTGVKLIWAARCNPSREQPDYQRSARIWHDGPGRTRLEFLPSDRGPARIVIENGPHRWFYSHRSHAWRPVSWRPPEPRLDLLLRNYRIVPGSVEKVAGRPALLVLVEPRFPGNPRKHAWLDLATGITLRAELYDSMGRLVSRSEFLRFHPESSLPAALFSVPQGSIDAGPAEEQHDRRPEELDKGGWRLTVNGSRSSSRPSFAPVLPRHLPPGYVLDRLTQGQVDGSEVVWALFTDGLNTLSLVQWCGPREPPDGGRGRFWGPGDRLHWSLGPVNGLLAGDLDTAELKRIVASLQRPRGNGRSLVTRK